VANPNEDQAAGLRRLFGQAAHPVASFFSAFPEDASHAALSCMASFAARGERVLLIDAVGGPGSICHLLHHATSHDLHDAVAQRMPLDQVLIVPQPNAMILPAARALREWPTMSGPYRKQVVSLIHQAERSAVATVVLVDANDPHSPFLCETAQAVACIPTTAAGLRSGYQLLKRVRAARGFNNMMLVTTQAASMQNGHRTVEEFCNVAQRSLDVMIHWVASLSMGGGTWAPELLNTRDRENSTRLADAVLFQNHAMAD
jgi:MinD-like ATPase involved in chromosome partitioning or flagellar assembly